MKRITVILALTTLAALMASPLMAAGVPSAITIQGRFTDSAGNNVADGVYTVAFRIYDDPIAGNTLWGETLAVQVTDGLYTVRVGTTSAIPANLFSKDTSRFLGITVNLEPEMAPRIPLSSGAYTYQAQDADVATLAQDLTCVGCVSAGEIAANAVGAAEIATNAVGSDEIVANAVGSSEIATDAVGTAEIATDAVGATEIASGAVGSAEIAGDAVGAAQIAAGAVGTSEVADGSLTAVDIDDEPGVASNTEGIAVITMDGTIQTLLSRSISGPVAGYVLAIATAEVTMVHTNGTINTANFGVSSTVGAFPSNQDVLVYLSSNAPSGTYVQAVTVHGLFSTAGGADGFYFLGEELSGIVRVEDMQLTLIYFPTAHGTVVSTAATGGEIISYQGAQTGSVLPETGAVPVQAQVADPVGFQLDQAKVIAEMEARIQKLEEQMRQNQPGSEDKR